MTDKSRDTDADWRLIAESNPYWGVLSKDEFKGQELTQAALSEFMSSGEQYIGNLFALIKKHLDPDFAPARALDFGCGVGRLVIPMARRAAEAVGVDIAPAMLQLAANNARAMNITNIRLCQSDDTLSEVSGKFHFINTLIVLQHIPPVRGYRIIQALLERLEIGGIGSIQLTYAKARKFFMHEQGRAKYYRRDGGVLTDLVDTQYQPPEGVITMFDYDLNQVLAIVSESAGHPLVVLPTRDDDHLGIHIVFRKAQ